MARISVTCDCGTERTIEQETGRRFIVGPNVEREMLLERSSKPQTSAPAASSLQISPEFDIFSQVVFFFWLSLVTLKQLSAEIKFSTKTSSDIFTRRMQLFGIDIST